MTHVPKEVYASDLSAAMQPLCELLGLPEKSIYAQPPIVISHEWITFCVAAGEPNKTEPGRRKDLLAPDHPQDSEHGILAYPVTVSINMGIKPDAS